MISDQLRRAIKAELSKPAHEHSLETPVLLAIAKSIREHNPESYDLSNAMDELVWVFSGGEIPEKH